MINTNTPQDTLESIRQKVMIRTGAAAGASFGYPLFESFVTDAHSQLWTMVDWKFLKTHNDQPLNVGEKWYDLPGDCAMEKIERVVFKYNPEGIEYILRPKIEDGMRSTTPNGLPFRYEVRTNPESPSPNAIQIEVYPVIQTSGILRIYYERSLSKFIDPADRSVVPSDLVFLFALYNAQIHFGKPSAESIGDQFKALLSTYRAKNRAKKVYSPSNHGNFLIEDLTYTVPPVNA
jgi:hypothetical protein